MNKSALNQYDFLKLLHETSTSSIWRAINKADSKPIIIKSKNKRTGAYHHEVNILNQLREAAVARLIAVEELPTAYLFIFEDVQALSLDQWLTEIKLSVKEFLAVSINIVKAIASVHNQGVIHNNLSLSNIIIAPDSGEVRLIDFKYALYAHEINTSRVSSDRLKHNLGYISPEQTGRINDAIDYSSDLYALGVIFYRLLTGKLPFTSIDPMEIIHAHLALPPEPPHQRNNEIPPVISKIVLKLLEKNSALRYQSAIGLLADLKQCQTDKADFPLAEKDFSGRLTISSKLYGRAEAINTIIAEYAAIAEGYMQVMLVSGQAGTGKSVLVKEAGYSLIKQAGFMIQGKFDLLQNNSPYSAIAQAFAELIQRLFSEPEEQLTLWKEKLMLALGSNGQVITDVIPELEMIIGKQPAVLQLGAEASQNRFNFVFLKFIRVFCQPEHPLIIFLDDLQWSDLATLKLLEQIIEDKDNLALYLIGAYRDDEVSPDHPFLETLNQLSQKNADIKQITLTALTFDQLNQLIADSLHHDLMTVAPLSKIIWHKTGGNPFFVNQFIHFLYDEKLLRLASDLTHVASQPVWQWDEVQISDLDITDNVVDLMVNRIKKLPEPTQQLLNLAACLGNRFDLKTLSAIDEKLMAETFLKLSPILAEGLVLPLTRNDINIDSIYLSSKMPHFLFLHDRVQQAAYALIDDQNRQRAHLKIARLLHKNTQAQALEERIFDIVKHYNQSIPLLEASVEKRDVAQLNLIAGQKAQAAIAYQAAHNYFIAGKACLDPNRWENEYQLTFKLCSKAAETAYLCADFMRMETLLQSALQHAGSVSDQAVLCDIQIHAYIAQGQPQKAIKIALKFLDRLGIHFSSEANQKEIGLALQNLQTTLAKQSIQTLYALPMMSNSKMLLAMRIMVSISSATYHNAPQLMLLLCIKQIELCLKYGNVLESSFVYACYGFILCGIVGDIDSGYEFGELALDLLKRQDEKKLQARVNFIFNVLIKPWKKHLGETLQPLLENYRTGLEAGDVEFSAYSINIFCYYSFFAGKPLTALVDKMSQYNHAHAGLKQKKILSRYHLCWQVSLNLTEITDNPCRLVGEVFDEEAQLPMLKKGDEVSMLHYLYLSKCFLHFLFQQYPEAIENAKKAERYLEGVTGLVLVAIFLFYDSLARLAIYSDLEQTEQNEFLSKILGNQVKMKQWAQHAPMNFLHKFYLVEAELARALSKDGDARELYDQAIELAMESGYINDAALAYELAGKFYLAKNLTKLAQLYLRDAHNCYQQWGALTKAQALERQYPNLFLNHHCDSAVITKMTENTGPAQWLDLHSILKASQTLSNEIILSRLLENMMRIIIENAGAEKGYLLFPKQNGWLIEAQGDINKHTRVLQAQPLEQNTQVSAKIINYVSHTHKTLVLHNAKLDLHFQHNARSVLCMPLIQQSELTGILYLENNLTTGAFTQDRLAVLDLLTSQVAISIKHAQLYSLLEEKVDERTRELKQEIIVRKQAEQSADAANRAKSTFLANMSHEIRTPLNSILGFVQLFVDTENLTHEQDHYINIIGQAGQHLLALVNDILDISKLEAGKTQLELYPFSLRQLLAEILDTLSIKAQEKKLALSLNCSDELDEYFIGDELRLKQIILNLISNAIKFTEKGFVRIEVSADEKEDYLLFTISDSGIGISQDNIEKIFEPFAQADSSTTRRFGGTGLGVSICKQLINLMQGEIWLESELGKGSQFHFTVQLPPDHLTPAHQVNAKQNTIPVSYRRKFKILLVDDIEANIIMARTNLESVGHQVISAKNGYEMLDRFKKETIDLIITDIHMPEMDGIEATQRIRKLEENSLNRIGIIALTASIMQEECERYIQAGIDAVVEKPLNFIELNRIMDKLVPVANNMNSHKTV